MSQPEIPLTESYVPPRASGRAGGTSYCVYGSGHPLVLIHGVGMRKAVWAPQIAELSARYEVVAYDMWGHGGSDLPAAGVELGAYAEQLGGLLQHLGMDEAHIVGHSMGALVALEFALSRPRHTSSLVALNAVYERSAAQSAAVQRRAAQLGQGDSSVNLDETMERWFGRPVQDPGMRGPAAEVRRFLAEADLLGYARTYALFARADRAHSSRLAGLQCRALFMTGELDENSLPAMSRRMAQAAPRGRAEVVPGARHMMTVTAAAEVNRRLAAFLECPQEAGAA